MTTILQNCILILIVSKLWVNDLFQFKNLRSGCKTFLLENVTRVRKSLTHFTRGRLLGQLDEYVSLT